MQRTPYLLRSTGVLVALLVALAALAAWQLLALRAADEADGLARARAVQALVESHLRADLARRAELVADDPAFAGYVEMAIGGALPGVPVDTTSLVDLLGEREERLGFDFVAVLDPNGRVVGSTSPLLPAGQREQGSVFVAARDRDTTATGPWIAGAQLFHVAVVPLTAVGVSEGFLMTAMPLGQGYVDALANAAAVDATLLRRGAARPSASSLVDAKRAAFVTALRRETVPAGGQGRVAGRAVAVEPLLGSGTATVAMALRVPPRTTWTVAPWLAAGMVVTVAFAFVAAWTWRRVLAPAALIAERLERARNGDLHLQVVEADAGTLAPLAAAFNGLLARLRDPPAR